jgi:hypothetical protein
MSEQLREVIMMRTKESLTEEIIQLRLSLHDHKDELEHERVRLAGCSVAANGYAEGEHELKPGDYGYSASFKDVLRIRRQSERFRLLLERLCVTEERERCSVEELLTHEWITERTVGKLIQWLRTNPSAPSISKETFFTFRSEHGFEE